MRFTPRYSIALFLLVGGVLGVGAILTRDVPTTSAFSVVAGEKWAWIGDSITESSPVTGVTRDPPRVLCDTICGSACSLSGEYTNAVAAAPDPVGYGIQYTCDANGWSIRNLGDSGDQLTIDIANRFHRQVLRGESLDGDGGQTCSSDATCTAIDPTLVCKDSIGVCGFPYDGVIILAGHNDLRSGVGAPGQVGADGEPATFMWSGASGAGLQAVIDNACHVHKLKTVVVSVLPFQGGGGWSAPKQVELEAFNALAAAYPAAQTLCTGNLEYVDAWPYVDANSDDVLDHSVESPPGFPDGIHPNTEGCEELADAVYSESFSD